MRWKVFPPALTCSGGSERALELLKEGDFRRDAGHLGLGQEIPADCSVNIYFLADLNRALARFGNRGYRAAQLEAAIMGGKIYLAAYAQRLGASGLTFFDDDVTEFFSPDAAGKSVMFLIAVGKSAKRKKLTILNNRSLKVSELRFSVTTTNTITSGTRANSPIIHRAARLQHSDFRRLGKRSC